MEALEKTWQEVMSMEKDTYTLVDTRDELSFAYAIYRAVSISRRKPF